MIDRILIAEGVVPGQKVPNGYGMSEAPKKPGLWNLFQEYYTETNTHRCFTWEKQKEPDDDQNTGLYAYERGQGVRAPICQYNTKEASMQEDCIECAYCGKELYYADNLHYGDDVYEIDGIIICEDCLKKYMDENHKRELTR